MADNAAETGSALAGRRKFKTFRVKELHPTFGAEIEGVDFPSPSEEQFQEILEAMAKSFVELGKAGIVCVSNLEGAPYRAKKLDWPHKCALEDSVRTRIVDANCLALLGFTSSVSCLRTLMHKCFTDRAKYGVCVFRNTGLNDATHVEFSRRLGDLDDIRPYMTNGRKMRYQYYELFDAGNVDENGNVIDPDSPKAQYQKGNALFHVDSSFNPRRASYSLLRAFELPPPGHGGNTDFADSRTAFDDLPEVLKTELLQNDYAAAHCLAHSRKTAAPEFFKDVDVESQPMNLHKIAQVHEPSNRMNLYIAAHAHHVVGVTKEKSDRLLETLLGHVTQEKYRISVGWDNVGDLIIWDNTSVLHRAGGGTFAGKYRRDMRRTTVHDSSLTAWGLNDPESAKRPGFSIGSSNDVPVLIHTQQAQPIAI